MNKELTKSIYDLELHEKRFLDEDRDLIVTRVPGGWIYRSLRVAVFVPFHDGFTDKPAPTAPDGLGVDSKEELTYEEKGGDDV